MEASTLHLILVMLALSIALNLKLTFSLLNNVRRIATERERPFTPPIGETVPIVKTKHLISGETITVPSSEQASTLLFLSSTCPKCREELPDLESLIPLLGIAGLNMWIVSQESKWRIKRFLKNYQLKEHALLAQKNDFITLNPTQTSPFYLFINHNGCLEAGGIIGDENWMRFYRQMKEIADTESIAQREHIE